MKKRILFFLLTFVLLAAVLAGCGTGASNAQTTPAVTPSASPAGGIPSGASAPSVQGALEGVTLNMGTSGTYAPFSYFAEDGKTLQGFDIDLIKALQDILGFSIASDTIQDMDYGPLATSVSQGKLDAAAAALCATDVRKQTMNFTDTYYDAGIVVIVGENNDTIKTVDDLKSGEYQVAVQTGTVSYEYAAQNLPQDCIQAFDSQSLAYKAVEVGQADATIYDAPGTAYSIKTGAIKLKIVGDEFFNGQAPYAIALSFDICKQYPDIVEDFNEAISYLQSNGTVDQLKEKWCE